MRHLLLRFICKAISPQEFRINSVFFQTCPPLYTMYPKNFLEPVYKPTEIDQVQEDEELRANYEYAPIKAALNWQTSSVFHDPLVNKFVSMATFTGLKNSSRQQLHKAFRRIKEIQLTKYHKAETEEEKQKIILNPFEIFHLAVENCKPIMELCPVRRGGIRYQVPTPVMSNRQRFLAMDWLIAAARDHDQKNDTYSNRLAIELIDAAHNDGRVVKKKQDLHRQCEANRAYAHYRWV